MRLLSVECRTIGYASSWSKVQSAGALSSRQRRTLVP
jgi:hypothetical protein